MTETDRIDIFLEIGKKRVIASAVEWPGWCRGGKDEASSLEALVQYGPRYRQAVEGFDPGFSAPAGIAEFRVLERLPGDATTDFGAPGGIAGLDRQAVDEAQLHRLAGLLQACWEALNQSASAALGKELRKGPRGGGRELDAIVRHVVEAHRAYLAMLGWKHKPDVEQPLGAQIDQLRAETLRALAESRRGALPERGPRGGTRWPLRFFVRRAAWHVLDHAWEIEDRSRSS